MSPLPPYGINKPKKKPVSPPPAPLSPRDQIVHSVLSYHCLKEPLVELPCLLDVAGMTPARRILEVGTYQGASAAALGLAYPSAQIWTIDLPDPTKSQYNPQPATGVGIAFKRLGVSNVRQILCNSAELPSWSARPERFDLGFVDGDHTEAACFRDLHSCADLLTPEGVLVAHDYTDESDPKPRPDWTCAVHRAVHRFAADRAWQVFRLPGWLVMVVDHVEKLHAPDCVSRSLSPFTCACARGRGQ